MLTMTLPRKTALGKRLTALRDRLDLTQEEAAKKLRVTKRTWIAWELGEYVPSEPHLLLIDLFEQGKI